MWPLISRVLLPLVLGAILGIYGYIKRPWQDETLQLETLKSKQVELETQVDVLEAENGRLLFEKEILELKNKELEIANRYHKLKRRWARVEVLERLERSDGIYHRISFQEIDNYGLPAGQKHQLEVRGTVLYAEGWIAQFRPELVEAGRRSTVMLFRGLFTDQVAPAHGPKLDVEGGAPGAYAVDGELAPTANLLWNEFWETAYDPQRRDALGIESMFTQGAGIELQPGTGWNLVLTQGGISWVLPHQL